MKISKMLSSLSLNTVRWICVPLMTGLGALWLAWRGPVPIMSGTTPLPGFVPEWYMLTAFPILGMLLADCFILAMQPRRHWAALELAIQIALLFALSSLRLKFGIILSGHTLLFAYFIVRRMGVPFPPRAVRRFDLLAAGALLLLTSYVKVAWWHDLSTLTSGIVIGGLLALVSVFILRAWRLFPSAHPLEVWRIKPTRAQDTERIY
jgi:hypothetical protein